MTEDVVALGIVGATGRMGHALLSCLPENQHIRLTGAVASAAGKTSQYEISGSVDALAGSDVVVDFSSRAGFAVALEWAIANRAAFVSGTTGLKPEDFQAMRTASASIPVLHASNFSVGVNLLAHLVDLASRATSPDFDVEVFEAHHRNKVDAPGGTALMLGRVAAEARELNLDEVGNFSRQGHTGARRSDEIGFQVVRGGSVVGEHTVFFLGDGERIELTHRATDREIFARGALRAAAWVSGKPAGEYSMNDILFG